MGCKQTRRVAFLSQTAPSFVRFQLRSACTLLVVLQVLQVSGLTLYDRDTPVLSFLLGLHMSFSIVTVFSFFRFRFSLSTTSPPSFFPFFFSLVERWSLCVRVSRAGTQLEALRSTVVSQALA